MILGVVISAICIAWGIWWLVYDIRALISDR